MRPRSACWLLAGIWCAPWGAAAHRNNATTSANVLRPGQQRPLFDDRPDGCPPCPSCFNCNTKSDVCYQFADCNKLNGRCACPSGFGGDDCALPLCGALPDGDQREPRPDDVESCECGEGWGGINCNVCQTDDACRAFFPPSDTGAQDGAVCYQEPLVVKENFQICDVTNQAIIKQLKDQTPQVTFSCNAESKECSFQFWAGQKESFYCALDTCTWDVEHSPDKNVTRYTCEHLQCSCMPKRFLCGEDGSVDLNEFLSNDIKGPATFVTTSTEGGSDNDGSKFEEPAMNKLIGLIFGDNSITMKCKVGECMYKTEVPGYVKPIPKINTPLIAGIIAGAALLVVAVALVMWYLAHRNFEKHGAIYLDDDDDENARLMSDHKPTALQFQNVSYHLNDKQILQGIRGVAQPGQVMAIMGASGAGKTTFLDILARKNKRGITTGDFYVNGEKVSDTDFKSVVGFVDQEDTMLPTLTVHETIYNSAMLRLPKDMGLATKEAKAFEVERQLGIYHIRNQLIGSEEGKGRGISGGEKRRVGIACELVTSPSILFLDEPTSGLDAFNAFNVIECLVTLARTYNRTVVFTIHQPRSNIVSLFDQLILLAKGRTVYSGPMTQCQQYFDSIGYSCPPGFNIADYLVDLTMHAGRVEIPADAFDGAADGGRTTTSSVRAIKSIRSVSNVSVDNSNFGSYTESTRRPDTSRQSIKQQQERKLFTRKPSTQNAEGGGVASPETPHTDDEAPDPSHQAESAQQWLKLSRAHGAVPPQVLDDPHQLPPPASGLGPDLDGLVQNYASSSVAASVRDDVASAVHAAAAANGGPGSREGGGAGLRSGPLRTYRRIGLARQFLILSRRTWTNLYRNPQLLLAHYAIAILVAVLCGFLYYGLTTDIKGWQDRLGLLFFILALFGFSTLTSLTVFASERLLFLRERANGYYHPVTYFATKVVFDIVPLRLLPPLILAAVVYPMTGLVARWQEFLIFALVLVLFNLVAATICLLIGILFQETAVASLIGSLVMLFSLLFAGFLLNKDAMPPVGVWLQKLSVYHYGLEALLANEMRTLTLYEHKFGLDIEVPGASILSAFGFDPLAVWPDVISLAIMAGVLLVLAYIAMHFLLVERR